MSTRVAALVAGAAATAFVLAALGWAVHGQVPSLASPLMGRPAPELVVRTFDGGQVSLSDLRGRPLVLNFWASWCTSCRSEVAVLSQAATSHAGGVSFLGVDVRDSEAAARGFLAANSPAYPVGVLVGGSPGPYRVEAALPQTYFIDAGGRVRAHTTGALTSGGVEGYLKEASS